MASIVHEASALGYSMKAVACSTRLFRNRPPRTAKLLIRLWAQPCPTGAEHCDISVLAAAECTFNQFNITTLFRDGYFVAQTRTVNLIGLTADTKRALLLDTYVYPLKLAYHAVKLEPAFLHFQSMCRMVDRQDRGAAVERKCEIIPRMGLS
eukprot:IDg12673t1